MDVELLIDQVSKRRPLWDKRERLHSNRQTTDKLWSEIAKEMKCDERSLRKKWKYLRDNFTTEYSKLPSSKSGDGADEDSPRPKWAYFQQLLFLKDIITPRASSCSSSRKSANVETSFEEDASNDTDIDHDPYPSEYSEIFSQGASEILELDNRDSDYNNDYHENRNEEMFGPGPNNSNSVIPQIPQSKKRKPTIPDDNYYYKKLLEVEQQKLQLQYFYDTQAKKAIEDEDSDLMFLKSLIPHIRLIPQHKKLRFQSEVQAVVEQYALYPEEGPS